MLIPRNHLGTVRQIIRTSNISLKGNWQILSITFVNVTKLRNKANWYHAASTHLWHAEDVFTLTWNPDYINIMYCIGWEKVDFMKKLEVWSRHFSKIYINFGRKSFKTNKNETKQLFNLTKYPTNKVRLMIKQNIILSNTSWHTRSEKDIINS